MYRFLVTIIMLLGATVTSFGQSGGTLSFEYKSPRNGKPVTASSFISDYILLKSSHSAVPGCYFAMGSCRFRVAGIAVIDSITFEGELIDALKIPIQEQILESQKYWTCKDCEQTKGYWITVPIYVAYTLTQNCSSRDHPLFYQSMKFWDSLFKGRENEQIQLSESEWLLAPVYSISMR